MTVADALRKYTSTLKKHHIDEAEAEVRVLLCHSLNANSAQLFSQLDRVLTTDEIAAFEMLIGRRLKKEPAAYITGHKEFFGLDLYVDRRVLIPRPETELLVEQALEFRREWTAMQKSPPLIADIGTGSGAIAIALALELPQSHIYAVDVSEKALEVAAINVERYRLGNRITLIQGNLLEQISGKMSVITANLPYIAGFEIQGLPDEIARYEPSLALNGGRDGLALVAQLIAQSVDKLIPGGCLVLEIGMGQDEAVVNLARDAWPAACISVIADLAGINRVIKIQNPF